MVANWMLFTIVMLLVNFFMVGPQLIQIAIVPSVLMTGPRFFNRGRLWKISGYLIAVIFGGTTGASITISIIFWVRYLVGGVSYFETPAAWLVGFFAAIAPSLQSIVMQDRKWKYDQVSFSGASPFGAISAMIVSVVLALVLMIVPDFTDYLFGPLLTLLSLVGAATLVALIFVWTGPKWREVSHRNIVQTREADDNTGDAS